MKEDLSAVCREVPKHLYLMTAEQKFTEVWYHVLQEAIISKYFLFYKTENRSYPWGIYYLSLSLLSNYVYKRFLKIINNVWRKLTGIEFHMITNNSDDGKGVLSRQFTDLDN